MITPDAAPGTPSRPFLLVQTRPEDDAALAELEALRRLGGFTEAELRVLRLDRAVDRHRADRPADGGPAHRPARDAEGRVDWEAELADVAGVILPGSPFTGSDPEESKTAVQRGVEAELMRMLDAVADGEVPFLGCCYGVGTLGRHAGGVVDTTYRELPGAIDVTLTDDGAADPLLAGLPSTFAAYVSHKEAVRDLPPGAVLLATGEACPVQMFRVGRHRYATQFHPELDQDGLIERLRIYAHHGYFPEGEAEATFAVIRSRDTPLARRILENFRTLFG
ncbi:glutamine amidotransferase [Micrococcus sp.]|uniref:glutamine amidotransferase n=1 Tax=Micrococcus sp. TaxID=1271 RepID=UPI002A91D9CE|nr:glutamine amidotransferase [Micrococcus sp.]MDY6056070.1 glutamine amidotransferase [Micrococcus sp.]